MPQLDDQLLAALTGQDFGIQDPRLMPQTQQKPQQSGSYIRDITQEMANKKQQDASINSSILNMLSQRFQPTMEDAARAVTQNVQAYAPGSGLKPTTMQDVAASRASNDLAPYTTAMGLQDKMADIAMKQAHANFYNTQGNGGVVGNLATRIKQANPGMTDAQAIYLAQTGYRQNQTLGPNGEIMPITGAPEAKGALKAGEKAGEKGVELGFAEPIATATARGKTAEERQAGLAKAQAAIAGFEQQSNLVTRTIDNAIKAISPYSTGYGSYLAGLPNTQAGELQNYLETIKANVGFDKLQQMRENSPTGGALGQVSDLENKLLQAVNGALDPRQSKVLKQNLLAIKSLYPQVLAEKKKAFNTDYGKYAGQQQTDASSQPPALPSGDQQSNDPLGIR